MSQFVYRFHKIILIAAAALSLIAILLSLHLRLDPNFFSLLPSADPGVKTFFEIADEIGFQSRLIAVVERPDHLAAGAAEAFVEKFAHRLEKSPLIQTVNYRTPEIDWPKRFDHLLAYLPLLLNTQELENLAHKLSDQAIATQVRTNRQLLMTPLGIASQELIALDPLGLRDVLGPRRDLGTGPQQALSPSPGIYRTADEGMYFLFITPTEPPQNIAFSKRLMQTVRKQEQSALKESDKRLLASPERAEGPLYGRISHCDQRRSHDQKRYPDHASDLLCGCYDPFCTCVSNHTNSLLRRFALDLQPFMDDRIRGDRFWTPQCFDLHLRLRPHRAGD